MSYYNYDDNDIAKTLKRAMAQGASHDEVHQLLQARNRKIDAGGEAMAMYKNDALTQEANAYLANKAAKPRLELDSFQAAREQVAAQNLREANRQHQGVYQSGVARVEADARKQERTLSDAYRKSELSDNERLAAVGLGKGKRVSSGYGESMRAAGMLNYQNALGQVRSEESAKKADLYAQYTENLHESRKAYNAERSKIAEDFSDKAVAQFNADRDYTLAAGKQSREANQWNQEFDAGQAQQAAENAAAAEQTAYDNAFALFEKTGEVTTEAMAETLGLPVGTKADGYNLMLQAFKQTGEVTTEEMAEVLGLPVGTKTNERIEFEKQNELDWAEYHRAQQWHEDDEKYRQSLLALKKPIYVTSPSGSGGMSFNNAFNLFKAVGSVVTEEMAAILGLPVGTEYWEYSQSQQELDFETGSF